MFGLVRFLGGSEPLAWTLQWMMSGTVVVALVMAWRSRLPYALKAAALATATLLVTPYLFLYDEMVLAIPVALLVRIGLADGFSEYELPALGCVALLLTSFPWVGAPVGLGATLIVAMLIAIFVSACPKHKPLEGTKETCFDKIDNDHDGKTDCADEKCKPFCDGARQY